MANPPITRFTSLAVSTTQNSGNPNNGLYVPPLNTAQIAAVPATTKVNGGIWYNTDIGQLETVVQNKVQPIPVGIGGGNVLGPGISTINNLTSFSNNTGTLIADSGIAKDNVVIAAGVATANKLLEFTGTGKNVQASALDTTNLVTNAGAGVDGNIVVFDGATGKVIKDSTVSINQVPNPAPLLRFANVLEASNATVNEIGNLGHIRFINDVSSIYVDTLTSVRFFPYNTQICSVFTSEIGSLGLSTSESALLEIHSDSGALLLSRLTTTERNALQMISGSDGTNGMLLFNTTSGTFNGYDGTNWRDLPLFNTNGTLDLNNKNIINLLDPTTAQQAATKNYVDNAIALPAAAKFIVQQFDSSVPNAQVLGALTTGLLKNTTTTGVLTIGAPGTDYYSLNNPTRIIDDSINFFIGKLAGNLTLSGTSNSGLGITCLQFLTTGTDNTGAGSASLKQTTTGISNSSFGARGLGLNTLGSYNSAFGAESLYNNLTASHNSSFGYRSLYANTLGLENSSFGAQSLLSNQGDDNCSFGAFSLTFNTIGSGNSSFGRGSLTSNNGDFNSSFGRSALESNVSGSYNASFGSYSGSLQASYNNCSFFGGQADASVNNLTNAIAIGYQASVGLSNSMVLGGSGANQLSVGIGITPHLTVQFQLPAIHANRKIVLYGANDNDHQVFSFGTAAGIFKFQMDNTTSNYIWYAGTSPTTSNELMRLTGTGFLGIGTPTPNAPLQFSNAVVNRKIVLFEATSNDHQVHALGTNSGIFRFQVSTTSDSYIWYAGTSSVASNELMHLTGGGFLGIGGVTPNAQLQLPTSFASRKLVLYDANNDNHQFFGLGVDAGFPSGDLRYQIDNTQSAHIFYAATSGLASNELMRLTGGGRLGIGTTAPNAPLQFSNALVNRKIVLYEATDNNHEFLGLGVNTLSLSRALRYQIDNTQSAHIWYAGTGASTSNELMKLKGNGFLGIGTTDPHAPLQFSNALVNRKIVLYEATDNDHEFYGLGVNGGGFRFQIATNLGSSYLWYAGTSSTTSNELMRLTGGGFLGIGGITPNGQLQLPTNFLNRKIVLFEVANNDHQFFGLGVNGYSSNGALRYQIDNTLSRYIWYAATSSTTSNELMHLMGNGNLGIGTNAPDQLLTVNSSTPSKITAGSWAAFSDARIKDIVGDYEHGLAEIIKIKTRKFKFNDRSGYPEHEKAKINIGIIAQEIEDIFPECIVEKIQKGNISDMRMYDGTALTYALINAVKELNNEITILKQQINN